MENLEKPYPEELPNPEPEPKSAEAEPHPDLVAKYSLFRENLKPKADVVYHPCGANDVSPSVAFPDSRVVYVDIDKKSVEALKEGGFEAHTVSALEFDPGKVDILIMLNPQIPPDVPASHVVENGFVLSNDYHGTASTLQRNDQYQIRAMVRVSKEGELIIDTENLEDYWKEIDTEEEFQNAPLDWAAANYQMAVPVVEAVTGKKENVLAEYKKIIATARGEQRQKNAQMLKEHPEMADFIGDADQEDVLMFNHEGRQFILATTLPRKKGTVDDIFVFQKIVKKESKES
jgi:hypothetical protein